MNNQKLSCSINHGANDIVIELVTERKNLRIESVNGATKLSTTIKSQVSLFHGNSEIKAGKSSFSNFSIMEYPMNRAELSLMIGLMENTKNVSVCRPVFDETKQPSSFEIIKNISKKLKNILGNENNNNLKSSIIEDCNSKQYFS